MSSITPDPRASTLDSPQALGSAPLAVAVLFPNGGETFQPGQQVNIQWTSNGATNQRVQYSLDNGFTFTPIVTGLAGNVQSTVWTLPANLIPVGQNQVTALIRVFARNLSTGEEVFDTSNAPFTIQVAAQPPTLSVTILSPNGGEIFQPGQSVNIQWQSSGATNQRVQYSLDGGVSFTPIVTGLVGNVQSTLWTIPANLIPAGQTQVSTLIRVVVRHESTGQERFDSSNAPFTIRVPSQTPTLSVTLLSPNGGESFQPGQSVNIQWQSSGATNQRVQYSLDGGFTFIPIVTGLAGTIQSTLWTIPTNIIPAGQTQVSALIRIFVRNENTGQELFDTSNSPFTIRAMTQTPALGVQVLSPNGGESFQPGQPVNIQWQSSGATNQRVQYSVDSGTSFVPIVTGLSGNVQSTTWTIPASLIPVGQTQVSISIRVVVRNDSTGQELFDTSNAPFTIRAPVQTPTLSVTVLTPNGGESFQPGQPVNIQWQSSGATSQRVQYSLDSGFSFTPIVTGLAGNVQSITWTIPATLIPSGQTQVAVLIRVVVRNDSLGQELFDTSNGSFFIRQQPPAPSFQFTPASGPAGSDITISGQFANVLDIRFGNVSSPEFFREGAASAIVAEAPTGLGSGLITVVTANGTQTSVAPFAVTAASAPPQITAVTPVSGNPGTGVTIMGNNFVLGATTVRFKAASGRIKAINVGVSSATQLTCTVPQGAITGTIKVTTAQGKALSPIFQIGAAANPPVIQSITPTKLATGRANKLLITGSNLPARKAAYMLNVPNAGIVSSARIPADASLAQILPEALATNSRLDDVLERRFTPAEKKNWPVELLIWIPENAAAGIYTLTVQAEGGTITTPFEVGVGGARQLFDTFDLDVPLTQLPPIDNFTPDPSIAALLNLTPQEIKAEIETFGQMLQVALQNALAGISAPTEVMATAAEDNQLLRSIGVVRSKSKPVASGRQLKIRAGTPLQPGTPSNVSNDGDALPDGNPNGLEEQLAKAFAPFYHISKGEQAGTGFAEFAPNQPKRSLDIGLGARVFPATQPRAFYRVRPLGIMQNEQGMRCAAAEIIYFQPWTRDDGVTPGNEFILALITNLFGNIFAFLATVLTTSIATGAGGHPFDEDFSAVLVAAPLQGNEPDSYPSDPTRYQAYDFYTAAHENTDFDKSLYIRPTNDTPVALRDATNPQIALARNIELWVARSKHATYHRNPDGLVLINAPLSLRFNIAVIVLEVLIQTIRVIRGGINGKTIEQIVVAIVRPAIITYTVGVLLRVLFTEKFDGDAYAGLPLNLINVGELPDPARGLRPINGATWITETKQTGVADVRNKFERPIWEARNPTAPPPSPVTAPTIAALTPPNGPAGTQITITGTKFIAGATTVQFNGVAASATVTSETILLATVPIGATTGPITVTTPNGVATSASNFTVPTVALPTITGFSPARGQPGTPVTISGLNFAGATAVKFNGMSVIKFSTISPNTITTVVPLRALTGPITVVTPAGTATSANQFIVNQIIRG